MTPNFNLPLNFIDPIGTQQTYNGSIPFGNNPLSIFEQQRQKNINNVQGNDNPYGFLGISNNMFSGAGSSDYYHTGNNEVDYKTGTTNPNSGVIQLSDEQINSAKDGYSNPNYVPPTPEQLKANNRAYKEKYGVEYGTEDEVNIDALQGNGKYRGTNFGDFLMSPAAIADVDLNTALFKTGQSFGFDADIIQNPDARRQAKRGNLMRGIGGVGKSLLNIGRLVGAGLGYQNRMDNFYENYQADKRKALVGNYQYKDGGLLQFFKNGGTVAELSPEKALTGEYLPALPKHAEEKANAELEKNEYVQHPNGDVQQVVGDTHEKGGVKVNLESGTKVISDNLKLGGDNAKLLRKDFDINVKASHTYADAIKKYTNKIGLTKLNEEQEKLFKKLSTEQEDTEDEATLNLNNQFLSEKINDLEKEKEVLLAKRAGFADFIFGRQESSKGIEEKLEMFEDGGLITDKRFKALCKKYNLDEQKAMHLYQQYKDGGIKGITPKFEDGGGEDDPYGLKAWQAIQDAYNNDPSYNYKDIAGEVERIKQFAKEYGVDISGKISDNPTQQELDSLAGYLQTTVLESNPNLGIHYGTNVAPTANGLNYLLEKGLPKDYLDGLLTSDGKIKSGTKEASIGKENIQKISKWAKENLQETELKEFAKTNFNDNKWFYRYPELKRNYYKDKETFNEVIGSDRNLGNFRLASDKVGLYENPFLLQDKEFTSQEEYDEFIKANKEREDENYTGYFGTAEDDHILYNPILKLQEEKQTDIKDFNPQVKGKAFGMPYLPDQSTIPPDAMTPHVKIEREYERLDPFAMTNEENLKEIFRSQDFAAEQINQLPDSQRRASLANLMATSQENINKSVSQVEVANAQNAQTTEQFNIGQSGLEENARAIDTLNFERRQLTALGKTQADLNNYFDYNRRVRLGNINTVNKFGLLNDLYENFNVSPFGGVDFDAEKLAQIYYNPISTQPSTVTNVTNNKQV